MAKILVVDDEASQRLILQRVLKSAGHETEQAANGEEALEIIQRMPIDLVLTDMRMPRMNGRELLRRIRELDTGLPVIVMTAYAELRDAVELVTHEGAFYYIEKPIEDMKVLRAEIERALATLRYATATQDTTRQPSDHPAEILPKATDDALPFGSVVGSSPPMRQLQREMRKLLPILRGPAMVLITGESGTGKELVARALHDAGPRASQPFVPVHCAAIPDELMEAELFGAEKGAYTGSTQTRIGYFEHAQGGTIFLDEIAEVTPMTQVKLLRVLSNREYYRVGSSRPKTADVCVFAATNKRIEDEVAAGRFRDDLFYRLNVFRIHVPPLRDRREDIPALAEHLLERFVEEFGLPRKTFGKDALATLRRFQWPGNVRQLDHYIQQAVVMSDEDVIQITDLPAETAEPVAEPSFLVDVLDTGIPLEEVEKQLIQAALERSGGNQTVAAKVLGVSRRKLQYRMEKHRISSRMFREGSGVEDSDAEEE